MTTIYENREVPTVYREERIGRTYFRVTSQFLGEIELAPTLEKHAVRYVCGEVEARSAERFRNC